jgi:hypothetical protein
MKKEWKNTGPEQLIHRLPASKGEDKNAVVVGWKSDSHEVGRQGSYDNVTMGKSPIR